MRVQTHGHTDNVAKTHWGVQRHRDPGRKREIVERRLVNKFGRNIRTWRCYSNEKITYL